MPAIRFDNVSKYYGAGIPAVENLDLVIPAGSFTTLLGPSGCGKTTTLRMIAGLEQPTGGEIYIGDNCVFSLDKGRSVAPSKRGLGLVFQSYALWPHLTVAENISFGLQVQRLKRSEQRRLTLEVAEALQIEMLLDRFTSELSGGQQQRVAIARVLVMRPKVLLLDEPLSNLDAKLRMDMRAELKRLHLETGATVVYVTHDQLEALTMSTHIALMSGGKLQQFAPPLELYAQPANSFAADFLGNPRINFLKGTVDADRTIRCGSLIIPLPDGLQTQTGSGVTVGLRAEEFALANPDSSNLPLVTVTAALPTGADWYYRVRLDDAEITIRDNAHPNLQLGSQACLRVVPDPLKVFNQEGQLLSALETVIA